MGDGNPGRDPKERRADERATGLERTNQNLRREIAERIQAEEALRRQKDFIDLVIQTSPHLIFVKDRDGTFLLVNQAMADSFGMSREEMLEKNNAEVHARADEVASYARVDREVIEARITRVVEESFTTVEGDVRWYHTIKTPLILPDGTVHVLGIASDITDLKRAQEAAAHQEALQRLVDELEMKNAELERFAYTVSHDLKAPLFTIQGFLGLLEQDALAGDIARLKSDISHISAAAYKMQRLLDELLHLSRVGHAVNPSETASLTDLAREALAAVAGQVAERGVAVDIAEAMPAVYGDRVRLLEVFQNLLENAVKFMGDQPAPRIEVDARREGGAVCCWVRDNGVGIDPRYHQKVYGLFERLDQQVDGTGVGLALVKRIVEVHGGNVWVESEGLGHGATFYCTLPTSDEASIPLNP